MNNVIEVNNLYRNFKIADREGSFLKYLFKRKYKTIEAVKDISFDVKKGELVGFIGPNGAGKSTTIKMMTGILVPTSGEVFVDGKTPHKNRKQNAMKIGVLFGQRSQLWWDLPVKDTYNLLKKVYRIPNEVFDYNVESYGDILGIKEFYNQPVRQLSLGQRMRADMGAALLHNPEILFLDEPTIGLDVVVKKQIRELIKDIRQKRGVTVVLTTHDMKDIEEICDRIVLIDKGSIIIDMPVQDVKHTFGGSSTIVVDFDSSPSELTIPQITVLEKNDTRWKLSFDSKDISSGKIVSMLSQQYNILDISIKEPEIDDIIRDLYENGAAEKVGAVNV